MKKIATYRCDRIRRVLEKFIGSHLGFSYKTMKIKVVTEQRSYVIDLGRCSVGTNLNKTR